MFRIPDSQHGFLNSTEVLLLTLLITCVLAFFPVHLTAQEIQVPDSSRVTALVDSSVAARVSPDTTRIAGRTSRTDGLKEPVVFRTDSLFISFRESGDEARLAGAARITYEDAVIQADILRFLLERNEFQAAGRHDTSTVGFQKGEESFRARSLAFNLSTGRGRFVETRTDLDEGFILAGVTKAVGDSIVYIENGRYTTCDCEPDETPSYYLQAARMKIANQKWIYTGPIQLFIYNIPLPVWLPFGVLPRLDGRRSGPLAPSYGEDGRGFYLKNLGWYWAVNEYMDLQLTGGIWSRGSWQLSPKFRYRKLYAYDGSFDLDFSRGISGEKFDADRVKTDQFALVWQHNQEINPTTRFTGNVNLRTSDYNRLVLDGYDSGSFNNRVDQTTTSRIQFSKQWPERGRSLTVNANHTENFSSRQASITLPNIAFTQRTRNPFQKRTRGAGQSERWFEKISYNYSFSMNNQYRFTPLGTDTTETTWLEALFSDDTYTNATGNAASDRFELGAKHSLPINGSFTIQRTPFTKRPIRLNITPNITLSENWYTKSDTLYLDETQSLQRESIPGFVAVHQVQGNLRANTDIYGTFPMRVGRLNGLRHVMSPSVTFSYQPDYSAAPFNYFRSYTDASGIDRQYGIVSGLSSGEQRRLTFALGNVFQSRILEERANGDVDRRIIQLFNLDLSSSYNFAADSLHFGDLLIGGRTRLFEQVDFSLATSWTPYAADATSLQKQAGWLLDTDQRLMRLLNLSSSITTSLRSSRSGAARPFGNSRVTGESGGFQTGLDPSGGGLFDTGSDYTDFAIPWSLNLNFTYNYRPVSASSTAESRSAILNTGFDFNLTPNWKIQGRSGFDFVERDVTTTTLSILRDLDCWEMRFDYTPFGIYRSFKFSLYVKSGKLRSILRLDHPKSDVQNRFDGIL